MTKSALTATEGHLCRRCGWRWMPRKPGAPKVCPRCHSPYWNDAKTNDELYWHWLEWAVGMHWLDFFRLAGKVRRGDPEAPAIARKLIRRVTDKAVSRARNERPLWKRTT